MSSKKIKKKIEKFVNKQEHLLSLEQLETRLSKNELVNSFICT